MRFAESRTQVDPLVCVQTAVGACSAFLGRFEDAVVRSAHDTRGNSVAPDSKAGILKILFVILFLSVIWNKHKKYMQLNVFRDTYINNVPVVYSK